MSTGWVIETAVLPIWTLVAIAGVAPAPEFSGFLQLPSDPVPAEITRGAHYWIGNEDRLDLFYSDVKEKGGVHIGVGAEQNWLLCGWSRPRVAVMMDFDQAIVDLHHVYFVAFAQAATKEEFRALWSDKSRKRLREGIVLTYRKDAIRAGALEALNIARWSIEDRFQKLEAQMAARGLPFFLTDDAQYAFLRELVTSGRAFAVRGDLTAHKSMKAIGAAATAAGLPVRTLYLSNAEQYFTYEKQTRANFLALPFDDDSVVLRTHGGKSLSRATHGNFYHYGVQSGKSFAAFVRDLRVRTSRQILLWAPPGAEEGMTRLTSISPMDVKAAYEGRTRATPNNLGRQPSPVNPRPLPCPSSMPDDMGCVPGGPFLRGVDPEGAGGHTPATPQAPIWVQTFWMDKHEVTVEQYQSCVTRGRCGKAGPNYEDFSAPRQPITGVSWYDAKRYCEAHGKRLPTEAEWEKAARGVDGRTFPWGNGPASCALAVYMDEAGRSCGIKQRSKRHADTGRPDPVGSRPATQFGLFDMAGNSWEWVADWFSPSWGACGAPCFGVNPKGPCAGQNPCAGHTERVVRGGSWYWPASQMTTWYRRSHTPANRPVFHHFGFRCARDLEEPR